MENKLGKSLCFYTANLGSEIQRIFTWKEKGDTEAMKNAYDRAVLIIEKIREFGNQSANAEMNLLEENIGKLVSEKEEFYFDRNQMSAYFNPFAIRIMNSL